MMKIDRMSDVVTRLRFVREALKPEPFPLDREGLYYAVGSVPIRQPSGIEIPARDLIDRLQQNRFESVDDVIESLRSVMQPSPTAPRHFWKIAAGLLVAIGVFTLFSRRSR